ncbi:cytochrome P450 [Saccharopolyspora spinosa]|uniref:Cytochrome P450 n=1 Tax=Saccharopolyspora spinosa TaxID=60894 RepID=A0A2N3Y5D4_SACSN|nr:cytochrome P450 [Saccharopolyspora spinosa]PKW18146.1 cytochrome P450 [Saccharopolyspora spinosa]
MIEELGKDFVKDPHKYYERMRLSGPVSEVVLPRGLKVWIVTGSAEARSVLMDRRLCKDIWFGTAFAGKHLRPNAVRTAWHPDLVRYNLLNVDPPVHSRLRRAMARALDADLLNRVGERVEVTTNELASRVPVGETIDLVEAFAAPLAFSGVAELVGIPEPNREDVHRWTIPLVYFRPAEEVSEGGENLLALLRGLLEDRRSQPGDDLLSRLAHPSDPSDVLSDQELISLVSNMVMAGYETTQQLISVGVLGLIEHPEQLAILRSDPTRVPKALDELLRWVSPAPFSTPRYTTEEIEIGGVRVPRGEIVLVAVDAVNHDPEVRSCPHAIDFDSSPTHIAFGRGIHFCAGASLARMQGELAFAALLEHFKEWELISTVEDLEWTHTHITRSLESLLVRLS